MGRRGFRSSFVSSVENSETETGCQIQQLSTRLPILAISGWQSTHYSILKSH